MANIQWNGLDQVQQNLLQLPGMFADSLRSAANTGATVIKNEVVARAPEDKGILKSAIYQKHIEELSGLDRQVYFVSWRKGKSSELDAFYGKWVEYGHWYVPKKPKGVRAKEHRAANRNVFVSAHPFLRPAFDTQKEAALSAMRSKLAENVRKAIAEINR
jgi:HK97 gp10 family phage protein